MLSIGLVLGLTVPPLLAQSDAPPKVQKWEQYCETASMLKKQNKMIKDAGDKGYEFVGAFNEAGALLCFRRPVR